MIIRLVHWLRFEQKTNGLYSYAYSLHKAALSMGIDSHICYFDFQLKSRGGQTFPNRIGGIKASPWSVP